MQTFVFLIIILIIYDFIKYKVCFVIIIHFMETEIKSKKKER